MGVTIIHKCDRCGHAQENNTNQMWEIQFKVTHINVPTGSTHFNNKQMWCRKCCDLFDMISPTADIHSKAKSPPEPTFEERLREFIRVEAEDVARQIKCEP